MSLEDQTVLIWGPSLPEFEDVQAKIKKTGKEVRYGYPHIDHTSPRCTLTDLVHLHLSRSCRSFRARRRRKRSKLRTIATGFRVRNTVFVGGFKESLTKDCRSFLYVR